MNVDKDVMTRMGASQPAQEALALVYAALTPECEIEPLLSTNYIGGLVAKWNVGKKAVCAIVKSDGTVEKEIDDGFTLKTLTDASFHTILSLYSQRVLNGEDGGSGVPVDDFGQDFRG